MKTQIVTMTKDHLARVVQIVKAHDKFDGKCAKQYFRNYFANLERVASPNEEHYVMLAKKKVVGVSGFEPDDFGSPDIYWLGWMYVDEAFQRRGLGSALLEYVIDRVRARGGRKLYLDTGNEKKYKPAIKFYNRFGFREEGRLRDYYDQGEHLLILGKYLNRG